MPQCREFRPVRTAKSTVILSVDEYEALRLLDREGFSQSRAAAFMQVSRPTVQLIYDSARKKVALALTEGAALRIEGGCFRLCDGGEKGCVCCKKRHGREV